MNNSDFNVMDMIDEYAQEQQMDPSEVFKRHPVSGNVKREAEGIKDEDLVLEELPIDEPIDDGWRPDSSLTDGMDEFSTTGVVYNRDEIKVGEEPLRSIADDKAKEAATGTISELERKERNITEAKKRHNIELRIPEGFDRVKLLIAAGDTDHDRAQERIDQVLEEIEKTYPEFIIHLDQVEQTPSEESVSAEDEVQMEPINRPDPDDVTVVIDKSQVKDVSWDPEELAKLKKARTIELKITETKDINFGSVVDADTSMLDQLLSEYDRKTNDVVAVLPASKYRATFTGLTYPEIIDLNNSVQVNNLDGERLKWTICYRHLKNPSIGAWREYLVYPDPTTGKEVQVPPDTIVPDSVNTADIHEVSKYEDFLRKTSYLDLQYMLWCILRATIHDTEVIQLTCVKERGGCGQQHDWIYRPEDLLEPDSVPAVIGEEMRQTGEASTTEEIMANYQTSPLFTSNYVELHSSKFKVLYGHISAYEYLNDYYSVIRAAEITNVQAESDPRAMMTIVRGAIIPIVKGFLIPNGDKYVRVKGTNNIVKVLDLLDEIDWATLIQLGDMMMSPYQFHYSIRDVVCPKCKHRDTIPIENMADLIFIVARTLENVSVRLTQA